MLTLNADLEVIGKPTPKPYVGNDGKQALSYKLNVAQNDGHDVATLSTTQAVYDSVHRMDRVMFECTVAEYGDKTVFRIASIKQFLNMPSSAPASNTSAPGASAPGATAPGASSAPAKR